MFISSNVKVALFCITSVTPKPEIGSLAQIPPLHEVHSHEPSSHVAIVKQ